MYFIVKLIVDEPGIRFDAKGREAHFFVQHGGSRVALGDTHSSSKLEPKADGRSRRALRRKAWNVPTSPSLSARISMRLLGIP